MLKCDHYIDLLTSIIHTRYLVFYYFYHVTPSWAVNWSQNQSAAGNVIQQIKNCRLTKLLAKLLELNLFVSDGDDLVLILAIVIPIAVILLIIVVIALVYFTRRDKNNESPLQRIPVPAVSNPVSMTQPNSNLWVW